MHCASLLHIISRVICVLKMTAFSLRLDLAIEINRHFLENEYSDLSFFPCCFELRNKFLYVLYGPILSVEQETIVGNVNLASSHSAIIRIYMV